MLIFFRGRLNAFRGCFGVCSTKESLNFSELKQNFFFYIKFNSQIIKKNIKNLIRQDFFKVFNRPCVVGADLQTPL